MALHLSLRLELVEASLPKKTKRQRDTKHRKRATHCRTVRFLSELLSVSGKAANSIRFNSIPSTQLNSLVYSRDTVVAT